MLWRTVVSAGQAQHSFEFTVDFFSSNIQAWKDTFVFEENTAYNFLEVGSLEGRATTWMMDNFLRHPDSRMTCIDTWEGSAEHPELLKTGLYDRFLHNIEPYRDKVAVYRGQSGAMLKHPDILAQKFDFIYIDAGHRARNVLEDAVLAFPLLNIHGALVFDDYLGGSEPHAHSIELPKAGIDAFLRFYAGSYKSFISFGSGYQLLVQKTAE